MHGDKARFGNQIRELERAMHAGRDEWLVTVVSAYHLMPKTQEQLISIETGLMRTNQGRGRGQGTQFIQDGGAGRGRGRSSYGGRGRGN